jgi:hypothetical protein
VFVLYAIPLGLLAGWLRGGRLERLGGLSFKLGPLALAGLLVQVLLFSTPVGGMLGDAVPIVYVASTALVLFVVWINREIPGMKLVALGAAGNLVAIVANGGYMPADPDALAAAGMAGSEGPTNSVVATNPALPFLTDIFALPEWVPFANVFSIGDVLIGLGLIVAIAAGMSREPAAPPESAPATAPVHGGTSPD